MRHLIVLIGCLIVGGGFVLALGDTLLDALIFGVFLFVFFEVKHWIAVKIGWASDD